MVSFLIRDSQRGPGGPPVPPWEFLVAHRDLVQKRRGRWEEAVNSIDCSHFSRKASSPIYGRSQHLTNTVSLTHLGQGCFRPPPPGTRKISGIRLYIPGVYIPRRAALKSWLLDLPTFCMHQLKIRRI